MGQTTLIPSHVFRWVSEQLQSTEFTVIALAGDASARRYFRLVHGENTWVLMSWEPFSKSNYPFLSVLEHFQSCGVQVPQVKAIGAAEGLLLLEDLGDLTLERKFWEQAKDEASASFYYKTIDELIKIHDLSTFSTHQSTASRTEFDITKFVWEMNYAKEHLLLGVLKAKISPNDSMALEKAFVDIATRLYQEPQVICHRDFHSRNVMIVRDKVYIIDFQDARRGPAQYDLVSLLKDSYVDISANYADQLMKYYLENSKLKQRPYFSQEKFQLVYELQSLQRCFKACGSFASFMNMKQDKRYLKYLAPTLKKVMMSLLNFPEYNILQKILIDSAALEKSYESLS